jgi:hypothetical protein
MRWNKIVAASRAFAVVLRGRDCLVLSDDGGGQLAAAARKKGRGMRGQLDNMMNACL